MKKLIVLLIIITSIPIFAKDGWPKTTVEYSGNKILYVGLITKEANKKTVDLYNQHKNKITELDIKSGGGDVDRGMDLGIFVYKHHLNVRVPDACMSSCANYVFTAGQNKYLGKNAILLFHGGTLLLANREHQIETSQKLTKEESLAFHKYNIKTLKRETAFFKKIHVDQQITVLGFSYHLYQKYKGMNLHGWYYSINDLAKLGVKNVSAEGGQWENVSRGDFVILTKKTKKSDVKNKVSLVQLPIHLPYVRYKLDIQKKS